MVVVVGWCVVWCGVVWCGAVWCGGGVGWCGVGWEKEERRGRAHVVGLGHESAAQFVFDRETRTGCGVLAWRREM